MWTVRRHLRRGVTAWLLCHALAFSALVPRDCCAAHAHAHRDAGAPACHELAPAAALCQLTGTCDAPATALSAVLLQGVTLAALVPAAPLVATSREAAPPPARRLLHLSLPPDAPPPRI